MIYENAEDDSLTYLVNSILNEIILQKRKKISFEKTSFMSFKVMFFNITVEIETYFSRFFVFCNLHAV